MMDAAFKRLKATVTTAREVRQSLRVRGAGTKDFYGESFGGEWLDTREYRGIIDYQPSELVLTAKCGTPLSEIATALAEHRQYLGFEPPTFNGDPSIGGIVASGLSGPRRPFSGAARDFVLGSALLTANGEVLRFGGQVMKNVAGFDVSRLLCGSLGILGLIAEVSLRVLPCPRAEQTLLFEMSVSEAIHAFNRWSGEGLPISGTAWRHGRAWVRLSGALTAVEAACRRLGGTRMDPLDASKWWRGLRDQTIPFFKESPSLWRFSLPSAAAPLEIDGDELIEWGGALRWWQTSLPEREARALAVQAGGTAMHWRCAAPGRMFHPIAPVVLEIHRRLKQRFDPHGIFNPGRLVPEL